MRTRDAILPDAEKIHELISPYSGDGTLAARATLQKFAKTSATSSFWNTAERSSAAVRCTFTDSILQKFAPLRLIRNSNVRAGVNV